MHERRKIHEQPPFFEDLGYPRRERRRQIIAEKDLRRKIEAIKKQETINLRHDVRFGSRSGIGIKPGVIAFFQNEIDGVYHSHIFLVTSVTIDRNGAVWAGGIITHSGKAREDLKLNQNVKRENIQQILKKDIGLINLKRITQHPFSFQ